MIKDMTSGQLAFKMLREHVKLTYGDEIYAAAQVDSKDGGILWVMIAMYPHKPWNRWTDPMSLIETCKDLAADENVWRIV